MADSNNSDIKSEPEIETLDAVKSEPQKEDEKIEEKSELQDQNCRQSMDEDDIPDNFFDDFSNNEFMDGLNVLDSWDENQKGGVKDEDKNIKSKEEETKDSGKKSEVEKSDQDKSDRGRYNRPSKEKDEGRIKRDYSPKRSPYRRGRSGDRRRVGRYLSRSNSPRRRRSRSRPMNSPPRRGRYCYSPPRNRDISPRPRRRDYSPYKSRSSIERDRSRDRPRRKSPRRSREKPEELRRDPAKTKHDIEKDKDKCLRYKEAKEFEKKIIVAESGLCPPGMEDMIDEINNSSFKSTERDPLTISFGNEKVKEKLSTERDHGKFVQSVKETDWCTLKFSSERKKSPDRNRSDRYRDDRDLRDIIKARLANKERSPPFDKSRISPDKRSRSNHSPINSRYDRGSRRASSPISDDSDREKWLRDYGRSEKRRKRSPFLHELARTLCNTDNKNLNPIPKQPTFNPFNSESVSYNNPPQAMGQYGPPQIFDPNQMPVLQHPMDHPPMPLINNGNFPFQPDVPQPFGQQQFAIPQQPFQQFQPPGPYEGPQPVIQAPPVIQPGPPPFQSFQPVPTPIQQFGNVPPNQVAIGLGRPPPQVYTADLQQGSNTREILSPSLQNLQQPNRNFLNLKDISSKDQQQLSKLFEDKKISLSDFLTVSAKGETVPCNIQEKIKVISRCQDAIKALDTTKKSGRFFPTLIPSSNEHQDTKAQGKWKSPLKKMTIVKFSFTTPNKVKENEVQNNMKRLLATINLREKVITPPPPRIQKSTSISESIPITSQIRPPEKAIIAVKDRHMQTDPYVCNVCEIRNARKFTTTATQTTNLGGLDEATQVTPSDLPAPPPPRGILKNSNYPSLSHLTAAQLREQDELRNQKDSSNSPGSFTSSSSLPRPLFDGPIDNNPEFNQPSKKMRPQFDNSYSDSPVPPFNSFDNNPLQMQNNPWSSSWNDPNLNPNIPMAQNLPSWKQNQVSAPGWKQSMPGSGNIIPPTKPWMSVLTTPPNKRNQNNKRGGFKRKSNNIVDLTN
ncbi:uncharacterized protein LOC123293362 [Chrysoperla carnea]|uniref:uncharacterized protein LOC123293362 n=1 Tax=Chrysoperla carnea TaxID=189513 RepID=UPI001D0911C5|nr:uncharacterized protein LOC123293362 [Chrysoperla carnea]